MKIWINGQAAADVSLLDRGLQYGDGLFETMRLKKGSVVMWVEHLARLQAGCQRLNISIDASLLSKQIDDITQQVIDGVLKLIVTRGEGERGYKSYSANAATIIWLHSESPSYPQQYYTEGVDVCLCKTNISRNSFLAGIKHLNRLDNVLARQEWLDEYQEGLMCDEFENIIEGTMSNFFAIKGDVLITPDLSHSGVAGITRQRVLDIARKENIETKICNISADELAEFDAVMVTNSLIGMWPVRSIGDHHYSIRELSLRLVEHLQACQN